MSFNAIDIAEKYLNMVSIFPPLNKNVNLNVDNISNPLEIGKTLL